MRFIIFLFFCFMYVANAGEKISEIGKIVYFKKTQSYYFIYFTDNNKVAVHQLAVANKKELEKIKKLIEKSVRIVGDLNWKRGNTESFSFREELTILKLEIFELNVLAFDSRKIIQQDDLISHYIEPKYYQTGEIPDKVANSLISSGAVAICVAAGPISLIPAALFGISQMFL